MTTLYIFSLAYVNNDTIIVLQKQPKKAKIGGISELPLGLSYPNSYLVNNMWVFMWSTHSYLYFIISWGVTYVLQVLTSTEVITRSMSAFIDRIKGGRD